MGSRSLRSRSRYEGLSGWQRTLLAKVKQQQRGFTGIFEVEVGRLFWKRGPKRGTRSTRVLRRRLRASGGRGDPDGREELQRGHVPRRGLLACA
jgi:hypothetical protein